MSDDSFPAPARQAIQWILWTIWKNRNSILYAETQVSIDIQLQQACEEARVWNELNIDKRRKYVGIGLPEECKKWEPPISGFTKCNIHASWRNATLHSGGNVLHHARDAFTFSPN